MTSSKKQSHTSMAEFLKVAREHAGLRQKDVATALGYGTSQFISNWERGLRQPSCQTLWLLAELYRINAEDLYSMMLEETLSRVDRELRAEFLGSRPRLNLRHSKSARHPRRKTGTNT